MARQTSGCSSRKRRSCASGAITTRAIRPPFTTPPSCPPATVSSVAAACSVINSSTGRTTRRAISWCGRGGHMHSRILAFAGALVLFSASAYAQATLPSPGNARDQAVSSLSGKLYGNLDFGGHFTSVDGDDARYQRYRDLRDGPLVDNVLFNRRGETWTLNASATKMGYRDQQFTGEYRLVGKVKAKFDWNQIPTFILRDARLLYTQPSAGEFRLPDTMQAANEARTTTLRDYTNQASTLDVRNRRDTGLFDFVYVANRDLDVQFNVTSAERTGAMHWNAPFGFSNVSELPLPLDSRTTDSKALVEWANQSGYLSVGWDGSWYNNKIETLIWDNP